MQPWLLLTNYHRYVDQFIHWGLEQCAPVRRPGWCCRATSSSIRAPRRRKRKRRPPPSSGIASRCPPIMSSAPTDAASAWSTSASAPPTPRRSPIIAVLRPHCWLMVGHCAGFRQSQRIGDYVLAHAYLRQDKILDRAVPPDMPIPALAEVQVALQEAVARVTGDRGEALKRRCAPAPSSPTTIATGSCAGRRSAAASTCRARSPWTWNRRPSPPRASACACPTARCCASPTSRCTARSSCPAPPTPSTSGRSASICRSASPRWSNADFARLAALAQAAQFRRAAVPVE